MGPSGQWEAEPGHLAHPASLARAVEIRRPHQAGLASSQGATSAVPSTRPAARQAGRAAAGPWWRAAGRAAALAVPGWARPRQMCVPAEGGPFMLTLGRCQSGQAARALGLVAESGEADPRPSLRAHHAWWRRGRHSPPPGAWPGPQGRGLGDLGTQATLSLGASSPGPEHCSPTGCSRLSHPLSPLVQARRSFIPSFIQQGLTKHLLRGWDSEGNLTVLRAAQKRQRTSTAHVTFSRGHILP